MYYAVAMHSRLSPHSTPSRSTRLYPPPLFMTSLRRLFSTYRRPELAAVPIALPGVLSVRRAVVVQHVHLDLIVVCGEIDPVGVLDVVRVVDLEGRRRGWVTEAIVRCGRIIQRDTVSSEENGQRDGGVERQGRVVPLFFAQPPLLPTSSTPRFHSPGHGAPAQRPKRFT